VLGRPTADEILGRDRVRTSVANGQAIERQLRLDSRRSAFESTADTPEQLVADMCAYIEGDPKVRPVEVFFRVDTDGSGTMDGEEFNEALIMMGMRLTPLQSCQAFEELDADCSGAIEIGKFMTRMRRESKWRFNKAFLEATPGDDAANKLIQTLEGKEQADAIATASQNAWDAAVIRAQSPRSRAQIAGPASRRHVGEIAGGNDGPDSEGAQCSAGLGRVVRQPKMFGTETLNRPHTNNQTALVAAEASPPASPRCHSAPKQPPQRSARVTQARLRSSPPSTPRRSQIAALVIFASPPHHCPNTVHMICKSHRATAEP
jgi:hypothetical protein